MVLNVVCKEDKYLPTYANETDACMDLKIVVPEGTNVIKAGESKNFKTGLQVSVPEGYVMTIYPRSSTGFKLHSMLCNSVGIIDSGYRDELNVKLFNYGTEDVEVSDAQRVAQFMLIPIPHLELIRVEDDELFRRNDRGGGIGSTGK